MRRAFKTVFHNGTPDERPIVTLSCNVNNGSRFRELDAASRASLADLITDFQSKLESFKRELLDPKP